MHIQKNYITPWRLISFILGTIFGLVVMVVPFHFAANQSIDTITFYYLKQVINWLGLPFFVTLITAICILSSVLSLIQYFFKPKFLTKSKTIYNMVNVNGLDVIFRTLGAMIAILVLTKTGPEFLIQENTGQSMLEQATQLAILVAPILFFQTFILEFGFMEFLGTLIGFVLRPLFKISPLASVSMLSAWLIPGNAAVISSKQLYDQGYFTHKEAVIISTTFAISSIGWIVVVCTYLGFMDYFWTFFGTITGVGIIIAMISVRIYPLNRYKDLYVNGTKNSEPAEQFYAGQRAAVPSNKNPAKLYHSAWIKAFNLACERNSKLTKSNFLNKFPSIIGYVFNLTPVIICWGTTALCLVTYFPVIFEYMALPIAWVFELFGFSTTTAHQTAPLILSSLADNYLPIALLPTIDNPSQALKFVIGVLSIIQLIYLSEIGLLLLQFKLTRNFWDIIVIFFIRTFIALIVTIPLALVIFPN
ncbi:YjiH family protein [Psittacicella gerlachiana]|uniref:Nucleoside recognition membrane protein YjiH n=1 Tax=Psittacicella gerlachiana TaxID=2028574 RepID=A0A3A1YD77_9GAMM|nr:hypothetical protein [Psittacicella gerlachiana]RIY35481.1 hypothetical protein CKF59_03545 [Psittacicella gerlachiana]